MQDPFAAAEPELLLHELEIEIRQGRRWGGDLRGELAEEVRDQVGALEPPAGHRAHREGSGPGCYCGQVRGRAVRSPLVDA